MIQSIAGHLKSLETTLETTQDSTDQSLASNASDHTLIRSEFANADDSLKSQIYKEIALDGKEGDIVYAKYDTTSNANRLTLGPLIEDSDLYDLVNDVIWKYNESTQTWVNSGKASESLEDGRLYFNVHSKVLFYMDKGIAIPLTQGF